MSTKSIVCFWRWDMPTPCSFLTSNQSGTLYCIHQGALFAQYQAFLDEVFKKHSNASYLLLLHEQPEFPASKQAEIIQYFEGKDCVVRRFSGGKEFIYFSDLDNTGLLWNGTLVKNELFMATRKKYSVLDDQDRILDQYFDGVWNHYVSFKIKRDLFEAHQKIQILLVSSLDELHSNGLIAYAEQNGKKDLLNYLQHHLSVEEVQKGIAGLPNAAEILQLHAALFEHLKQDMNIPGYQSELNRLFVDLMDKLPGNIY